MKTKKVEKNLGIYLYTGVIFVVFLGIYFWSRSLFATPLSVNEIGSKAQRVNTYGCYLKQVQCFQAPCEPVVYCPVPVPASDVCTQEYGTCQDLSGACHTYTDGCDQAYSCAAPLMSCAKPAQTTTTKNKPGQHCYTWGKMKWCK